MNAVSEQNINEYINISEDSETAVIRGYHHTYQPYQTIPTLLLVFAGFEPEDSCKADAVNGERADKGKICVF